MINKPLLNPKFNLYTPSGKPNLNWAINRYYYDIQNEIGFNNDTDLKYRSDYNNTICQAINPNIPVEDYNEETIHTLFSIITSHYSISEKTIQTRHKHLIENPIKFYFRDYNLGPNPCWGASYKFNYDGIGIEAALKNVQRSFSYNEAYILANTLLKDPEFLPGEYFGINLCLYSGARLNEGAGTNFRDLNPMKYYPGEYKLNLGLLTTQLHKNILKLSGKTWNAPRIVPVLDVLADIIIRRKEYIKSKLSFPLENEDGRFESVDDLPIVCKGNNYTKRSGSDDISRAGRKLFIEELKFDENRMAGISELMFRDPEMFAEEKSATCYTCRRDFATELSIAFRDDPNGLVLLQYYIGHLIEDKRFKRNDLTDEFYLHQMKQLLEKSHRVNIIKALK